MAVPRIEVVAAVLADAVGRVLLDQRPAGKPHAGWWEFPGGKLEPGETPSAGLRRELAEELGIEVLAAAPFLRLSHCYPEREVVLHCWRVSAWRGEPQAHDGQGLGWFAPDALPGLQLLPADDPIVDWLRGPDRIAITPAPETDRAEFLADLARCCAAGARFVQLRAPGLDPDAYAALARAARTVTRAAGAALILNCDPALAAALDCDGLHLSAARLRAAQGRPVAAGRWLSASVHDAAELARARALDVDLVLIGPVRPTATHPGATPLGWDGFAALAAEAGRPCYALGGLALGDAARARQHGARGIATVRASWPGGR
jgi:8-oxo-dGTP diphosphatase